MLRKRISLVLAVVAAMAVLMALQATSAFASPVTTTVPDAAAPGLSNAEIQGAPINVYRSCSTPSSDPDHPICSPYQLYPPLPDNVAGG